MALVHIEDVNFVLKPPHKGKSFPMTVTFIFKLVEGLEDFVVTIRPC